MGEVGRADDALKAILILRKEIEKLRETLPTNWMEQVEKKNKEIKEKQADHATHKKSGLSIAPSISLLLGTYGFFFSIEGWFKFQWDDLFASLLT